jgi:hypothetical protein
MRPDTVGAFFLSHPVVDVIMKDGDNILIENKFLFAKKSLQNLEVSVFILPPFAPSRLFIEREGQGMPCPYVRLRPFAPSCLRPFFKEAHV